jgi:hypothetical protein
MEQPVGGRYAPAFDCHATVAGMLSPTLIRKKVRQVRAPRQKCSLAPSGVATTHPSIRKTGDLCAPESSLANHRIRLEEECRGNR